MTGPYISTLIEGITVKFLNFGTPEIFAVMYQNSNRGQTLSYFVKMMHME